MELSRVKAIARELMVQHGLSEWDFLFNRCKRVVGKCYYNRKCIQLSEFHALHDDESKIRETILHEIAHAIAGHKAGHGPEWEAIAARVGCKEIVACGKAGDDYHKPKGTWYAICPGCRKEFQWYRKPKRRFGVYWHCRSCGRERGNLIPVERKQVETPKKPPNFDRSKFDQMFDF